MAHRRRAPAPKVPEKKGMDKNTRDRVVWGVLAVVFLAGLLWLVLDRDPGLQSEEDGYVPVAGFQDVHGLAVDPEHPEYLYIATHHGLVRAENASDFARVGDLQNDYMGFTAHPTQSGVFWVSGHPSGGGNMGVRKSTDGGFSWEELALGGRVDFHAMTISPADPDVLWGFYNGQVHRSDDGGHQWKVVGRPPEPIHSFAADPQDVETVYGATGVGLLASHDGGVSWQEARPGAHNDLAIHPAAPETWYAARPDGVERSTDGGATWQRTALDVGGTVGYLALHPEDPQTLYAATFQTGLHRSTDGGDSWTTLKEPGG